MALITPILLDKSAYGAYFLFGGLTFATLVVLAIYMPETRGQALESIQEVFAQPLRVRGVSTLTSVLRRRVGARATAASTNVDATDIELEQLRRPAADPYSC